MIKETSEFIEQSLDGLQEALGIDPNDDAMFLWRMFVTWLVLPFVMLAIVIRTIKKVIKG